MVKTMKPLRKLSYVLGLFLVAGCGTVYVTSNPQGAAVFGSPARPRNQSFSRKGTTPCSYMVHWFSDGEYARLTWPDGVVSETKYVFNSGGFGDVAFSFEKSDALPKHSVVKTSEVRESVAARDATFKSAVHENPSGSKTVLGRQVQVGQTPSADSKPPEVVITTPAVSRGMKIIASQKSIIVRGTATDVSGVNAVSINGKEAALFAGGAFAAQILLAVGENIIVVEATDMRGNSGEYRFTVNRPEADVLAAEPKSTLMQSGIYFALLIACQEYISPTMVKLECPIADATKLKTILTSQYSFDERNVTVLRNPTRKEIIAAFDVLSRKLTQQDNLLIFYAGHGYWDEQFSQGYWLPSNAAKDDRTEWISNGTVREFIRGIKSRHTLLIADSCFSGAIFTTRDPFSDRNRAVDALFSLPSRKAITSGTLNEVPDRSVFVQFLLKRLSENNSKYFPSQALFASFRESVINNSPTTQVPQFGVIREAGDEGGDFIFQRND